jgi:hypothetical protein
MPLDVDRELREYGAYLTNIIGFNAGGGTAIYVNDEAARPLLTARSYRDDGEEVLVNFQWKGKTVYYRMKGWSFTKYALDHGYARPDPALAFGTGVR